MSGSPAPTAAEQAAVARDLAAIEARYGERLDDAGRAVLAARLLELNRLVVAVRAVPLTNVDAPLPDFTPAPVETDR